MAKRITVNDTEKELVTVARKLARLRAEERQRQEELADLRQEISDTEITLAHLTQRQATPHQPELEAVTA